MAHTAVSSSLGYTATYAYDADGARVLQRNSDADIFYVGSYHEKDMTHNVRTTYYYFGGARVGMRQDSDVYWLHGDHLGSASLTTNITGAAVSEMRYYPFGETRWVSGTIPTDRLFTGQREDSYSNIIEMGARWYSALLGRFLSADSIVPRPGDSQAYNRYAYSLNNPVNYLDPSGHDPIDANWENDWRKAHCPTTMDCVISDIDRQARLYSIAYSGPLSRKPTWTEEDWLYFGLHRDDLMISKLGREGLAQFTNSLGRLAYFYKPDEKAQFVSGIALLYAGWRYDPTGSNIPENAFQFHPVNMCPGVGSCNRPYHVNHGMQGFDPSLHNGAENTHHYAGHLILAFHATQAGNSVATVLREVMQWFGGQSDTGQDINLGLVAGGDSQWLRDGGSISDFAVHAFESLRTKEDDQ